MPCTALPFAKSGPSAARRPWSVAHTPIVVPLPCPPSYCSTFLFKICRSLFTNSNMSKSSLISHEQETVKICQNHHNHLDPLQTFKDHLTYQPAQPSAMWWPHAAALGRRTAPSVAHSNATIVEPWRTHLLRCCAAVHSFHVHSMSFHSTSVISMLHLQFTVNRYVVTPQLLHKAVFRISVPHPHTPSYSSSKQCPSDALD